MKQVFYILLAFLCVGVIARAYPQDDFGDSGGDDGGGGGSDLDFLPDTPVDQDDSAPDVEQPPAATSDPPTDLPPPETSNPSPELPPPDTSDPSTDQTPPDSSIQPIDEPPAGTSLPSVEQPQSPPVDPDVSPVVEPSPTPTTVVDSTPAADHLPAVVDPTPVVDPPLTPLKAVDPTPIIEPPTTPEPTDAGALNASPPKDTDLPLESLSVTSPPTSDDPGTSALPSDAGPNPSSIVPDDDNTTLAPETTPPPSISDLSTEVTPATDASLATASDAENSNTAAATDAISPTASGDGTVSTAAATDIESSAASDLTAASITPVTESSYSTASGSDQVSSILNSQTSAVAAATSSPLTASESPQVTQNPSQPSPTTPASRKAMSNSSTAANKALASNKAGPIPGAKPTTPTNGFVTYIRKVYELAQHHGGRDPNRLVMEWLRHEDYDNFQWTQLVSYIDETFIQAVKTSGVQMIRTLKDPGTGIDIKVSHFGACMNGVIMYGQPAYPAQRLHSATNRADVTGWGGDLITFYGDWQLAVQGGQRHGGDGRRRSLYENIRRRATSLPGGDYARQHMATRIDDNTFKLPDMIEDADCYNIATKLRANPNLSIADEIQANLGSGYKTRMQRFYNGRFGSSSAAQAIVKDMLVPGYDVLVNAGRTKLIFDVAGPLTTLPFQLRAQDLDDFTKGVADRFQALVAEEANGTL